jgi:8-oxo-dGTP diphosphatase
MARKVIHAAGGIVVRKGARLLIAVVQRAKDELWVLPRGKLKLDETPIAGARREVIEETGHRVRVHEFLGAISYRARGRPKIVQFWRMQAAVKPSRNVMKDIMAVEWLTLSAAVRRLSYPLEKLFLRNVGRTALRQGKRTLRGKSRHARKMKLRVAKTHGGKYGGKSGLRRASTSRIGARKMSARAAARPRRRNILQRVLGGLSS